MKTGIVIPSFNEAACLPELIRGIEARLPGAEICVVDDTPGGGPAGLEALAPGRLSVIRRGRKGGRGSAVLEGMEFLLEKGCGLIVEMDADLSHPPARLPGLVAEAAARRTDLLIASRYMAGGSVGNWPLGRQLLSLTANLLARRLLGLPVRDCTGGFRVYSRRAALAAAATCGGSGKGFIVLSEILVNLYYRGYALAETPLAFTDRVKGKSSLGCGEVLGALAGLFKVWRLKRGLLRASGELKFPLEA